MLRLRQRTSPFVLNPYKSDKNIAELFSIIFFLGYNEWLTVTVSIVSVGGCFVLGTSSGGGGRAGGTS